MSSSLSRAYLNPCSGTTKKKQFEEKLKFFPPWDTKTISAGYVHTHPLIEIFQVRIDKFDDFERRGELYGKIEVVDLEGSQTLYHRDRENSEPIRANCNISLTSPPCAIPLTVGFNVNIDLRLRGDSEDVILSNWQLSWNALEPTIAKVSRGPFLLDFCDEPQRLLSQANVVKHQSAGYEQPLSTMFEGPDGSCITMFYSVFQHAVQAWIQVEIVDLTTAVTATEYSFRGSITAGYGKFWCGDDSPIKEYCKATLLKSTDLQPLKSERWTQLQLSRHIIAVPAYSSLIIEADLWDTSGIKIAKGKVEFTAENKDFGAGYIKGDAEIGIRVIVGWEYGSEIPSYSSFETVDWQDCKLIHEF